MSAFAVIPLGIKLIALLVSVGMFYWEPGTPAVDRSYLVINIIVAVVNTIWILYDSRRALAFGVAWGVAWALFVALQWPLLGVKHPGLYLAVALSARAVAVSVRKHMK